MKKEINQLQQPQQTELQKHNVSLGTLKVQKVNSTSDIVTLFQQKQLTTLVSLKKQFGEGEAKTLIVVMLDELNEFLDLKKPLTDPHIRFIVEQVFAQYYYLSVEDLQLFFNQVKGGFYGEFFESISPAKLMNWLGQYANSRFKEFENYNATKDNEYKSARRTGQRLIDTIKGVNTELTKIWKR